MKLEDALDVDTGPSDEEPVNVRVAEVDYETQTIYLEPAE